MLIIWSKLGGLHFEREAIKLPESRIVSIDPDNMESAGLPDEFDGVITMVRMMEWSYDGKYDPRLAARVSISPDPESGWDSFEQFYSAGDLDFFKPTNDGTTPLGPGEEGIYTMRTGTVKKKLNNNTNWSHFMRAILAAGFPRDQLTPNVSCLEGSRGHFVRIDQEKRSGLVKGSEDNRTPRILVMSDYISKVDPGVAVSTGASAGATSTSTTTRHDIDDELTAVVLIALTDADGSLSKKKLPTLAMKSFEGSNRAVAVKRVIDGNFLGGSDSWEFNSDTGELTLQ